ncbi:MAG: ABC transporter ATP-binding protein, partial [Rhodospirillales bacterium]|nr:ABC transporter ATP-binding protein [Rhodospirillales bacterium]
MTDALLSVRNVSRRFVGLLAVDRVSFDLRAGEVVSIIGPNGAGKTTLFNLLTGQVAPSSGEIRLRGALINRLEPHRRARLGMGRTFQIARPLVGLTVLENAMIGAFARLRSLRAAEAKALVVLEEVGLLDRAARKASELTLSERRRLEVARALAMEPDIILLDEVMAGLNPSEVARAIGLYRELNRRGLTFLVIEHNLKVVRSFAGRVIVLDHGAMIAEGRPEEILAAPAVVEAYV